MSDAIQEIRIPDIGDAEDVVVIELCVAPGDQVEADDALIVIESDKASMEVPAGVTGVVEALLVAIDDEVVEGQAIARIERAAGEPAAPPTPAAAKAAEPQDPPAKQPQPAPAPPPAGPRAGGGPVRSGGYRRPGQNRQGRRQSLRQAAADQR